MRSNVRDRFNPPRRGIFWFAYSTRITPSVTAVTQIGTKSPRSYKVKLKKWRKKKKRRKKKKKMHWPWGAAGSKGCRLRELPCARWSCYSRMPGSRPRNPPRPSDDEMSWGCSSGSRSTWVSTVARRSTRTKRPPWRPSPRDPRPRAPEVLSCSLWHPTGTPSLHPLVAFHHAPLSLFFFLIFLLLPLLLLLLLLLPGCPRWRCYVNQTRAAISRLQGSLLRVKRVVTVLFS